ncbi:WD40 repeat domain-containing protein [Streptosporangium roseum]|uniref:WD40 repeat domain-containing protein n=1 Tax=Streptosporangium roseum TaxID=2001 RepID=UPI0011D28267|nr:WD40 repeat domain-containing protein [Streptosporangium roseum]
MYEPLERRPGGEPARHGCALLSPDGHLLATAGADRKIRLWRSAQPPDHHVLYRRIDYLHARLKATRNLQDALFGKIQGLTASTGTAPVEDRDGADGT